MGDFHRTVSFIIIIAIKRMLTADVLHPREKDIGLQSYVGVAARVEY